MLKWVHFLPALVLSGVVLVPLLVATGLLPDVFGILLLGGMAGIALLAFVQSFARYKALLPALLSIPVLFIQVFAYGAGFIKGLVMHLLGMEPRGFVKNYYGKKTG